MKSIDIIEPAQSYYLLSKDHKNTGSKPVFVGGRIKLEYIFENIPQDMIIATSGNDKKCIILMDYSLEDLLLFVKRGNQTLLKLKSKN